MKKLIIKYPLLIIALLATLLRLPLIGNSFWMDEAAQALEIIRPLNQQLDIIADFQPPLLHFILHFAQYFSQSEWFLRTVGALIPGIITIIYTYKIAENLFSKKVAFISALLLATSSFHIYFSQELRPYSLPTALALVSMFYFINIVRNNMNMYSETPILNKFLHLIKNLRCASKKNKSKFNKKPFPKLSFLTKTSGWIIHFNALFNKYSPLVKSVKCIPQKPNINTDNLVFLTIFNILGLYSSYLYPFFMLSQITYTLFNFKIKKIKSLLISFGFSILAFIPFLPIFFKQLQAGGNVRKLLPGWDQVVSIPQLKALPLVFGKLIFGVLPLDINPFIVLFSILLGVSGTLIVYKFSLNLKNLKKLKKTSLYLLFFWLVIPLLTAWIVSFIVPVIRPKRLLFLLPGLYILFSYLSLNFPQPHNWGFSLFKQARIALARITTPPNLTVKGLSAKEFKIKTKESKSLNKLLINPGAIFLSILFLINIFGTISYYINPKLQREDWRSLNTELYKNFNPQNTLLIYSFTDQFAPMKWYELQQENPFDTYSTNVLYIKNMPDLSNSIKVAASYRTVIVFDYLRDLTDPTKKIEAQLSQLGFKEVGVLDYPNIGFIRIFTIPLNVIGLK